MTLGLGFCLSTRLKGARTHHPLSLKNPRASCPFIKDEANPVLYDIHALIDGVML